MRPEDSLLYICTRQDFTPAHIQQVLELSRGHTICWEVLFSIADRHGVAPLVFSNLKKCRTGLPIPPEVYQDNQLYAYQNAIWKEARGRNLARALTYFQERAIPVMLIKGGAMDLLVYEQPWYTVSKDFDLILRCRRSEISPEEQSYIMAFLHETGLEYDFYRHHDVDMNGALSIDFDQIWADAQYLEVRGHSVATMCPEDLLISLCINSCRKRYLRLKSLLDISEVISRFPGLGWDLLAAKARKYDCQMIVFTALVITEMTVGCALPEGIGAYLGVERLRARVIQSLSSWFTERSGLSDYPFHGPLLFGRHFHPILALTYASYRGYQIQRKMREIWQNWRAT